MVPPQPRDRAVATWLFVCAAFVASMVAVGGLTRLTRSGLSIVEWKPILGALPPVGDSGWAEEFAKYQASPEARLVNVGLSIDGFKQIYYVEWFHRLLGRITGVVVLVPLLVFIAKRRLGRHRIAQLLTLFALGGLQGLVGWLMVKSGLVDAPHVSPYRLTAHLLLALLLFAALFWVALDAGVQQAALPHKKRRQLLSGLAKGLLALLTLTITWGGLMAGYHAGLVAPTFPTFNGVWVPDGMWLPSLGAGNLVENAVTIHFTHRMLAYLVVVLSFVLGTMMWRAEGAPRRVQNLGVAVASVALLQAALGAMTVLTFVRLSWASMHQFNAVVLLSLLVASAHQLGAAEHRS